MQYPFSLPMALNDTSLRDVGIAGFFPQQADRLYVWNGSGYESYTLKSSPPAPTPAWYSTGAWGGSPTTDVIPLRRLLVRSQGNFTWVEDNPYLSVLSH
jgi:hypothetical protein